ncbi:MAG: Rad52/Rad22 family DNA repair protein [Gemmatimonadaceae bacterium]
MIARHEAPTAQADIWGQLAAPLPAGVISWRQDGKPVQRDGRFIARWVAYIEANTVRERLDRVVAGEWNLTLELLPPVPAGDEGSSTDGAFAFRARLQILGVVREDVGMGKDYKQASTDAFKRVAVRFGIGHELYALEQNWVPMDGDGRYAKPLEDPQDAYDRRHGNGAAVSVESPNQPALALAGPMPAAASDVPPCPKCGGRMWDNRIGKRNPKAPDFKCRDRSCDGVVWPPKAGSTKGAEQSGDAMLEPVAAPSLDSDEVPF